MTRKIAAYIGVSATIITLIGGIFVIDDRYYKTAEAAEYRERADIDRESGDVELRMKMIELELQVYDNPARRIILEKQMDQLLERQNKLIELQQGQ